MFKAVLLLLIALSNLPSITPCVALYGQCGGNGYNGSTQCCNGSTCQYNNDYYSQCLTGTVATTKPTSASSTASAAPASAGCNALYSQCGGQNWPGSTCCINSTCVNSSDSYSQCLQTSSTSPTSSSSSTKPSTSVSQASTSSTKPSTSATQASTSSTKPSTSAAQASTSSTKPSTSATQASTSSTKPSTSATQASTSSTKPSTSATQASTSSTKPSTSAAQASTSSTKPSTSATQASTSSTKPSTSATQASTSSTKPSTSATQASTSSTKPSTSATQASTSSTKPSTSATQASTSSTKPSTSATQASTSSTKPSTSATQASTSSTKPSTSATQASTSSTKPSTSATQASTSSTNTASQGCSTTYSQCGGITWTGSTQCCSGSQCQYNSLYYSQCLPISGASTSSSSTVQASTSSSSTVQASTSSGATAQSSTISAGNDGRTDGITTRYWDCCKASCAWTGKASVTSPVKTCLADGITSADVNAQSGCNGGSAYMCNNQQPWNVSATLSYGYAAAYISGQGESNWCCACYSLVFTTAPVAGQELIVQVTNTGSDLGSNQFDLQMPGGGVGIFNGCLSQFPGTYSSSWGQQYGGVSQRTDCFNLPSVLLSGCLWRFDWFMNANNPSMRFKQITCPSVLTANTQCIRQ